MVTVVIIHLPRRVTSATHVRFASHYAAWIACLMLHLMHISGLDKRSIAGEATLATLRENKMVTVVITHLPRRVASATHVRFASRYAAWIACLMLHVMHISRLHERSIGS